MYTQEERAYLDTFEPDMGNSGLGNLINMFALQPWMDNQAVTGLAKSNSIWLQKALSNTDEMTSFASRHMFGSRFITGGIEKTPILNKILPKNSKRLGGSILKKIFPNTEFYYNKGFNEQVAEGTMNFSDSGREELLKTTEKLNINKDGELAGKGFTWSNKSDNDLVRKLRKLGVTANDFENNSVKSFERKLKPIKKTFVDLDKTETLKNTLKKDVNDFLHGDQIRKNVNKYGGDTIHANKYQINAKLKGYRGIDSKRIIKTKNSFEVEETLKLNKYSKEEVYKLAKNKILSSADEVLKSDSNFGNITEYVSKITKDEDFEKFMKTAFHIFKKDEELTLSSMQNIYKNSTVKDKKMILEKIMKMGKLYAKANSDDIANDLATRITSKTAFQKFFSSGFGKVITQVGTGPLAMGLNVAGMIIGGIASNGQEKAVNNMYKTIFDRGLLERQPVFIPNEATMHSLQTHMQRSENDLEEYKKIYYYRNTSNELRNDISPINGDFLNIENVNTN